MPVCWRSSSLDTVLHSGWLVSLRLMLSHIGPCLPRADRSVKTPQLWQRPVANGSRMAGIKSVLGASAG
eukprot:8119751-Alexandrium_andersonii.AAC.1